MTHYNRNTSNISLEYEIGYLFLYYQVTELPSISTFKGVIVFLCNICLDRRKGTYITHKKMPLESWKTVTHM